MDQVEFEPTQHWSATILKANEHDSDSNSKTRCGKSTILEQDFILLLLFF